jgi:lytic transglycosylase, catalytic
MSPFAAIRACMVAGFALLPAVASASCWEEAAQRYGIDPLLLKAIAWQESRGWTGAIGPKLPDGNQALGLMQINTIHLPALAKFGIRREDLFDACINQKVGAWILADCMRRFGQIWRAVGCYYAGPGSKNFSAQEKYVSGVRRYYEGYRCKSSPKGCACEGS